MILSELQTLFWDVDLDTFVPELYTEYTIFRVLELGDKAAVEWLRRMFPETQIRSLLSTEHRLSRKSANFWALVYGIPSSEVAALDSSRQIE
jgi:hypothetical protein